MVDNNLFLASKKLLFKLKFKTCFISSGFAKDTNEKIMFSVMLLVIILGTLMYIIEGSSDTKGFDNIPNSIYWAIVTLTTVGYGDVFPATAFGKVVASFIMILGYGIIAVPTGIVTSEFARRKREKVSTQACPDCTTEGHEVDSKFCKKCGAELNP